jgi:hypothetical protein
MPNLISRGGAAAAVLVAALCLVAAAQAPQGADAGRVATLRADYQAASQSKDWPRALAAAQEIVRLDGDWRNLRLLGEAQYYTAAYPRAVETLERAIAGAEASQPADSKQPGDRIDALAAMQTQRGNALLKMQRNTDAVAAYTKAAEYSSDKGRAYFNICATLYNMGDMAGCAGACRKSIGYDATRADAYFVLGSALFVDAAPAGAGKMTISKEARDALQKYLELAPDGPHAADVKAMLEAVK